MSVLVLNAGSTSVKFGVFNGDSEPVVWGHIDWRHGHPERAELVLQSGNQRAAIRSEVRLTHKHGAGEEAIDAVRKVDGEPIHVVGHRVVHGGAEFSASTWIDGRVKSAITRLCELAPLHNPPALRGIEAVECCLPGIPQVAVFDTALYASLPETACLYPLPYEWHQRWGIRRFGFHGLSHGYCSRRATELLGSAKLRVVSCHLGGGCSATALVGAAPVATTMGFSPLEGLMMGTRSGSVDPGLLLYLQRECGLSISELDHALNEQSGLLGISGISPDLAQIEAAAGAGSVRARLAFDMFADRVKAAIGSLAATMGGLDAIVFTDRIGEGSPALRWAACEGLAFMGIKLDPEPNRQAHPDCDIAAKDSSVRVLVIHTREELVLAREALRLAGSAPLST